jgi:hypothetical protein
MVRGVSTHDPINRCFHTGTDYPSKRKLAEFRQVILTPISEVKLLSNISNFSKYVYFVSVEPSLRLYRRFRYDI